MSKVIILLDPDAIFDERDALLASLESAGFSVTELESLPDLLIVEGTSAEDFPFKDAPGVILVEDDAATARPADTVTIEPRPVCGPWPKLRHISRANPWGRMTPDKLPWSGEFSCARNGEGVDFYIVDTGIVATHQGFNGRATVLDGFTPLHTHGTTCASMGGGETIGIAPGVLIWSAAGLRNADNTGSTSAIITAINACLTHYNGRADTDRPAVLSMSFSSSSETGSNPYSSAMSSCMNAGLVCVAAAANDIKDLSTWNIWPAEQPGVIAVGGLNMDDGPYLLSGFGTNYGLRVDILAGSQDCRGADMSADDAYRTGSGTSYGTPYVAGIIACILQSYRRLTSAAQVQQVGKYLYDTATFGAYKPDPRQEPMTPAIAYLDPGPGPWPPVPTLEPKV